MLKEDEVLILETVKILVKDIWYLYPYFYVGEMVAYDQLFLGFIDFFTKEEDKIVKNIGFIINGQYIFRSN